MSLSRLTNKRILLGVTGGIAAYKAAEIIRRLQDAQAEVRVVMTRSATEFITPLTLQALSGNPVHLDLLDTDAEAAMGHIELAKWADVVLIAPASANFIARLANGHANDLLTTLCLATIASIAVAPAMNQAMWLNKQTQENCKKLQERKTGIFGPGSGTQACGDVGPGRMLEPLELVKLTANIFPNGLLDGIRLLITAGPTREAIDPVRYISNHSSGKMGFALAKAGVDAGAKTTLIAGPVELPTPARVERIDIVSAEQMHDASLELSAHCDIFIASAAVADYRPVAAAQQKIKKNSESQLIELVRNPDILADVAAQTSRPFCVGFAAETQDVIHYAQDKLQRKKLDMIIANDVSATDIGFNAEDNAVTVIWPDGQEAIEKTSKHQLAKLLIKKIALCYQNANS